MSKQKLQVIGLFAGVGGIETGLQKAGFSTLIANEIDGFASQTYKLNHQHPLVTADIADVTAKSLSESLELDHNLSRETPTLLAGGFPCQPFSVAGYRKGFDDERGNVYWHILRLIAEIKPEVIFLENVKNLENHDAGNTFSTILKSLRGEVGSPDGVTLDTPYYVKHKVLNSKDFGVPQNRERIYIVAFRDKAAFDRFEFPEPSSKTKLELSSYIDFNSKVESKYYYDQNRPFYEQLRESITEPNVIYQWRRKYVRANKSGVSPTLTANMGMGGHNVPLILTSHGIRKLTPRECFRLMGFPNIKFPVGMADSRLYKQAGNSVVVDVIAAIGMKIAEAL